jgi:DNA-binding NarL/FixJ family response regulator
MLRYGEDRQPARLVRIGTAPPRVAIADPQPLVLEGLAQVLRNLEAEVTGRCSSGDEILASIVSAAPDLLIMDAGIGEPDGLAVLREIKGRGLQIPVVLLSGQLRDGEVLEAVQLGIRGLVAKDASIPAVERCLRTVLEGGSCLDQELIGRAMSALLARETALRELAAQLTAREMQVLEMVVSGARPRDAAGRLQVSEGTLKVHLHHIYQKLNVGSREHLISYARQRGLA